MTTVFGWLIVLFLGAVLLLFVLVALRATLSLLGLGRLCCRLGWHWWWGIDLHVRQGLTTRTTTYLVVGGKRISRCLTCEKVDPPEGESAYQLWKAGGVEVAGGPLSKPTVTFKSQEELAEASFDKSLERLAASPTDERALADARRAAEEWVNAQLSRWAAEAQRTIPSGAHQTPDIETFLEYTQRVSRGIADEKIAAALARRRAAR